MNFERRNKRDWARLAMKLGLLFTEPKVRRAVGDRFRDRFDDVSDVISEKYDDAVDRLSAAGDALRGTNPWPSRTAAMLMGVGIGAALGILLAPASGQDTRRAIRDHAADLKNRAMESAESFRSDVTPMRSTGTQG